MELTQPFIKLPFLFDAEHLAQEVTKFDDSAWMAHPNRLNGNSAIALISQGGGDNDDFSGRMMATPHLALCDYTQQVMASFGEVLARSRLMRLAGHSEVTAHVDFNYHWYNRVRIHVPVITNPDVVFYCGNEHVHMQAGECWIFDSWRKHKVVNNSSLDRVHLVIDTAGSSRFWSMVDKAVAQPNDPTFVAPTTEFDHNIKTERFNVAPVMAPGELEAIAKEIMADILANPDNDPNIAQEYNTLLRNLAKDWREVWLQFGHAREAHPRYQSLLNRTVKHLRPNPRVLVTASNNVGVNPIVMQRLLRAALNTDQYDLFVRED